MKKRLYSLVLCGLMAFLPLSGSLASALGPAETIEDLRDMLSEAEDGDLLLVTGDISMNGAPLESDVSVRVSSQNGDHAILRSLHLKDASIIFSDITLEDSVIIDGASYIHLSRGVTVHGAAQSDALRFNGRGTLIIEPGCTVTGGSEGAGLHIIHGGGEFYSSIEGVIRGGAGKTGGTGVVISPLLDSGAVMISGSVQGGDGESLGGHALNLYELSGHAYITVDGNITGGSGVIGGDGIQLVSVSDNASVGISGRVKGGTGDTYGGNALILMGAEDSSSFNLSGSFSGGDTLGDNAQPGTSLRLVGDSTAIRARIDNCILEDGRQLINGEPSLKTPQPTPVPTPAPTPEPTSVPIIYPNVTPLPEITAPGDNIAFIITPEPPKQPKSL